MLEIREHELSSLRMAQLFSIKIPQQIDFKSLLFIHKHLFQDVYDWAGMIRTVDISKGGTRFANCQRIEPEAEKLMEQMDKENGLAGLPKNKFCERIAHYFSEMNVLHPFREGNGRATRLFFSWVAANAGYQLDFDKVSKADWNEACIHGYHCRMEKMEGIFANIASPLPPPAPSPLPIENISKRISECRVARSQSITVSVMKPGKDISS